MRLRSEEQHSRMMEKLVENQAKLVSRSTCVFCFGVMILKFIFIILKEEQLKLVKDRSLIREGSQAGSALKSFSAITSYANLDLALNNMGGGAGPVVDG